MTAVEVTVTLDSGGRVRVVMVDGERRAERADRTEGDEALTSVIHRATMAAVNDLQLDRTRTLRFDVVDLRDLIHVVEVEGTDLPPAENQN